MSGEQLNLNPEGKTPAANGGGADPNLVEVKVGGELQKVPIDDLKRSYASRGELTKEYEKLKKDRETLEQEMTESKTAIEYALQVQAAVDADEKLKKYISGDKKAFSGSDEEEDTVVALQNKISELEKKQQNTESLIQKKDVEKYMITNADEYMQKTYGLSLKDLADGIQKVKENKNPAVNLAMAAALPTLIERAKQQGIEEGKKQGSEEVLRKTINSPITGGGTGQTPPPSGLSLDDAAAAAYKAELET